MKKQARDPKTPIKTIFCANDQVETIHKLSASPSGEIQAICSVCGRLLKFPADTTPKDFQKLVDAHKLANEGQVTVNSINAKLSAFSDNPTETTIVEETTPKE